MENAILRLQNISKYYYGESSVTQALRKVNLEFYVGEFVAITGESGSGKSTLLNILSGMLTFEDGELYFEGKPTFQYSSQEWEEYRKNKIGFVFQDYRLIERYSVLDNVIAALLIQGSGKEQAQELALDYIERVGLMEQLNQRACNLSSGQKQRLSIARALAKNTDVIVADEPTGNLDTENAKEIIALLEKLSEEKLVIMVTHNYEMAKDAVSRKIVLHDGEIIEDESIDSENKSEKQTLTIDKEENIQKESQTQKEDSQKKDAQIENTQKEDLKKESKKSQKNTNGNAAMFFAVKNIVNQKRRSMLFFSLFFIMAMISFFFLGQLFLYSDDRMTRNADETLFQQQEDNRILVRKPDNAILTMEDLEKVKRVRHVQSADLYGYANEVVYAVGKAAKLDNEKNQSCVKSSTMISKKDLSEGRLPENREEIVMYSKDKSVLNQTIRCSFASKNNWGKNQTYGDEFRVVGLLKEKTEQIYFHSELCRMLTIPLTEQSFILHYGDETGEGDYIGQMTFLPVVSDKLKGNTIRISKHYDIPYGVAVKLDVADRGAFEGVGKISVAGEGTLEVTFDKEFSNQQDVFIMVSSELYEKIYFGDTVEISAYISDYRKTDSVIRSLRKMGYDAASTYRVSRTRYNPQKVTQRLQSMGIASGVLIVGILLHYFLMSLFLKLKHREYELLHFLGLEIRKLGEVLHLEMLMTGLAAVIVAVVCCLVAGNKGVLYLGQIVICYSWLEWGIYVLYQLVLIWVPVHFFVKKMQMKWC